MEKLVIEYDKSTTMDECGNFVTEAIEYESKEKFLSDLEQAAKNQYLIGKAIEQQKQNIHDVEIKNMISPLHRHEAFKKALAKIQQLNLLMLPYEFQLGSKKFDTQYFYDHKGQYHPPRVYTLDEWFELNK